MVTLAFRSEIEWIRHVERVVAMIASSLRVVPERDNAELFGVPRRDRLLIAQITIVVLAQAELVCLDFLARTRPPVFICFQLIEVLLNPFTFIQSLNLRILCEVFRLDKLDSDEALEDMRVRNALQVAFLHLGKGHTIIIFKVKFVIDAADEVLGRRFCLYLLVKVLIEEVAFHLFIAHGLQKHGAHILPQHIHHGGLVLHFEAAKECSQTRICVFIRFITIVEIRQLLYQLTAAAQAHCLPELYK